MNSSPIKETINRATSWLKILTDFGVMLIITFIIIDILFPGTTGIIGNLTEIVQTATGSTADTTTAAKSGSEVITNGNSDRGLVGLVALLLFLFLLRRDK
ncbi:MAG: hypothetical protein H8D24_01285 [Gammaproteobacteria bacterium]|uniref:Uncharacterized protein n=1 Tax=Candidatus Thiopontia autotrophica TaxID=2841688 RepID=A0A8J6P681_9GAMM|nr:hypothetical protein [Candidatus Thiopontia autotrophica]MBL6969371.1 hypothetical protein [Gammaproteobacteria bacterium]